MLKRVYGVMLCDLADRMREKVRYAPEEVNVVVDEIQSRLRQWHLKLVAGEDTPLDDSDLELLANLGGTLEEVIARAHGLRQAAILSLFAGLTEKVMRRTEKGALLYRIRVKTAEAAEVGPMPGAVMVTRQEPVAADIHPLAWVNVAR